MTLIETNREPYVGPRPFEESDRAKFFGRTQETNELVSLITAHQVVLLYAQSGAGKTSLVRAGLIPKLIDEEQFDVLPPMRVREQTAVEAESGEINNVFMFNCLMAATHPGTDQPLDEDEWKKLTRVDLRGFLQERKQNAGQTDQFRPTVLVFDQFEELFTLYPERWEDRSEFFEQVQAALAADPLLRVLFCMREDFIAEVDPYAFCLPEKLRTRFRIERLNEQTGLLAVTEPLRPEEEGQAQRVKFADGIAKELVDNLLRVQVKTGKGVQCIKGKFIEPLQLQVVCQTLWNNLGAHDNLITREHLEAFGDVDKALSAFYENAVKKTSKESKVKTGVVRRWCEQMLITASGTRATVFRGPDKTAGLANNAVDELERQSLIRMELRGAAQWYELTHDRFVEVIQQSNQQWMLDRPAAEQGLLRLEGRAETWNHNEQRDSDLLNELEFREAQNWLQITEASEIEPSKELLVFIRESEKAIEAQRQEEAEKRRRIEDRARAATRLRWLAYLLAGVSLLAMIALGYASYKAKESNRLRHEADQRTREIEESKKTLQVAYDKLEAETKRANLSELANSARNNLNANKLTEAEADYSSLLKTSQERNDKKGTADALVGLANVYFKTPNYLKAKSYYEQAVKELGTDPKFREDAGFILCETGHLYFVWGDALNDQQRENDALRYYQKAITTYRDAMRKFDRNTGGWRSAKAGFDESSKRSNSILSNPFRSDPK